MDFSIKDICKCKKEYIDEEMEEELDEDDYNLK